MKKKVGAYLKRIRIYSRESCLPCLRLKQWMMVTDSRRENKISDIVDFYYDHETGDDEMWDIIKGVPYMYDSYTERELVGENDIRKYLDEVIIKC